MAISVQVPKDLAGIKTKVALNLTKRQIICCSGAAVAGIPSVSYTHLFQGGIDLNVFEAVKQSVTTRQAAEHYGIHVGRNGMACCQIGRAHV